VQSIVRVVEGGRDSQLSLDPHRKAVHYRLVHKRFKVWQISYWTIGLMSAVTSPYKRRNSLDISTGYEAPPRRRRMSALTPQLP